MTPRVRILLLSNSPDQDDLMRALLPELRELYELRWVDREHAAVSMLCTQDFRVVICDLSNPARVSWATLHQIREAVPHVAPLVLTADEQPETLAWIAGLRVRYWLTKREATPERLMTCLQVMLHRQRSTIPPNPLTEFLAHCHSAVLSLFGEQAGVPVSPRWLRKNQRKAARGV